MLRDKAHVTRAKCRVVHNGQGDRVEGGGSIMPAMLNGETKHPPAKSGDRVGQVKKKEVGRVGSKNHNQ